MNKKGEAEGVIYPTVIFVVLNIMFFSILLLFVFRSSGGAVVYEQAYAKQISLIIDSAKPIMEIKLNMEEAMKLAEENKINFEDVVKIEDNLVTVKLSERGGYSCSFISDVDATAYPDAILEGNYIIIINKPKREI
jgi:hypothetical protein